MEGRIRALVAVGVAHGERRRKTVGVEMHDKLAKQEEQSVYVWEAEKAMAGVVGDRSRGRGRDPGQREYVWARIYSLPVGTAGL